MESIARYVNGLSYAIQDEFNVPNFHSVVEGYQVALRIEEIDEEATKYKKNFKIWKREAKREAS